MNDVLSGKELGLSDVYPSQASVASSDCVAYVLKCVGDGLEAEDEMHGSQLSICTYEHLEP